MLKWLGFFAIVASVIVSVAYEQHYTREKYEAKREKACIALAITFEQKYSCAKEAQSRKEYSPWWYVLVTWPEGITTWAIIATGFVIAWQSNETRKAARGALLNAQAVINAERAWVVMVIERDKERPRLFRVKAENRGNTPAKIVSASHECTVVKNETEMPEHPQYRHESRFPVGVFLFPGEFQLISEFSRDHLRTPGTGEDRNGEVDFRMLHDHEGQAIIFGNVVYKDILSSPKDPEHETRWCSLFKLGDTADEFFLTRGRDGYTTHT